MTDKYIWKVIQPLLKIEATWSGKRNGPRKWKYTGESDVTSIYIRFTWLDASMPACIHVRLVGRRVLGHLPQAQEGRSMFTSWGVWTSLHHKIMIVVWSHFSRWISGLKRCMDTASWRESSIYFIVGWFFRFNFYFLLGGRWFTMC